MGERASSGILNGVARCAARGTRLIVGRRKLPIKTAFTGRSIFTRTGTINGARAKRRDL